MHPTGTALKEFLQFIYSSAGQASRRQSFYAAPPASRSTRRRSRS